MGKFLGVLILFLGSQAAAQTVFLKGYGLTPLTAPNLAQGLLGAIQQQASTEQPFSPQITGIRILEVGTQPFQNIFKFVLGNLNVERNLLLQATLIAVVGGQPQIHSCFMEVSLDSPVWLEVRTCRSKDSPLLASPLRLKGEHVGVFSTMPLDSEPATTTEQTKMANSAPL